MIYSADNFFSPVTAAVETGMAVKVEDPNSAPEPWTIIQGWKTQWTVVIHSSSLIIIKKPIRF